MKPLKQMTSGELVDELEATSLLVLQLFQNIARSPSLTKVPIVREFIDAMDHEATLKIEIENRGIMVPSRRRRHARARRIRRR